MAKVTSEAGGKQEEEQLDLLLILPSVFFTVSLQGSHCLPAYWLPPFLYLCLVLSVFLLLCVPLCQTHARACTADNQTHLNTPQAHIGKLTLTLIHTHTCSCFTMCLINFSSSLSDALNSPLSLK